MGIFFNARKRSLKETVDYLCSDFEKYLKRNRKAGMIDYLDFSFTEGGVFFDVKPSDFLVQRELSNLLRNYARILNNEDPLGYS